MSFIFFVEWNVMNWRQIYVQIHTRTYAKQPHFFHISSCLQLSNDANSNMDINNTSSGKMISGAGVCAFAREDSSPQHCFTNQLRRMAPNYVNPT